MIDPVREYVVAPRAPGQRGARHRRRADARACSSSTASWSASTAAPSRSTGSAPTATSRPPSTATSSSTGSSTARSPSSRCRRGDGHGGRARSTRSACATCSSSSSSSRASASSATSLRSEHALLEHRRAVRRPRAALVPGGLLGRRRPAGAHGDAPVEADELVGRVPRHRPPVPPAGPDPQRRGHLQRAVQDRPQARRQPRPAGERRGPCRIQGRARGGAGPADDASCSTRSRPPRAAAAPPPSSTSTAR